MNELSLRNTIRREFSLRGMEKPRRYFWWVEESDSAWLSLASGVVNLRPWETTNLHQGGQGVGLGEDYQEQKGETWAHHIQRGYACTYMHLHRHSVVAPCERESWIQGKVWKFKYLRILLDSKLKFHEDKCTNKMSRSI